MRNSRRSLLASGVALALASCLASPARSDPPSLVDVLSEPIAPKTREETEPRNPLRIQPKLHAVSLEWVGLEAGKAPALRLKERVALPAAYRVYRSDREGTGYVLLRTIPVGKNRLYTFTDDEVRDGQERYYSVRLVDEDGREWPIGPAVLAGPIDVTRPTRPVLKIESGDRKLSLTWNRYEGESFDRYVLRRTALDGDPEVLAEIHELDTRSYDDVAVENGKVYSYTLTVKNKAGIESRESVEAVGKPRDLRAPDPPGDLRARGRDRAADLVFTASPDEDVEFYRIYQAETPPIDRGPKVRSVGDRKLRWRVVGSVAGSDEKRIPGGGPVPPTLSFRVTGLRNDRRYIYKIAAVDLSGNEGPTSLEAEAAPVDTNPPDPPDAPTATPDDGAVAIEWRGIERREPDLAGYKLYRRSETFPAYLAIDFQKRAKDARPMLAREHTYRYLDRKVANGETYRYHVTVIDAHGNESAPSRAVVASPRDATPPLSATGLVARAVTRAVDLSWKAIKDRDLAGYMLYRLDPGAERYARIAIVSDPKIGTADRRVLAPRKIATAWTDAKVLPGAAYRYKISTYDDAGNESEPSEAAQAIPFYPNVVAFSRAYVENRPYTFGFWFNPNSKTLYECRSFDNKTFTPWKGPVPLPEMPPNFAPDAHLSFQEGVGGLSVYCYNPSRMDITFANTPDRKAWGRYVTLCENVPEPPNGGGAARIFFERDEKGLLGFSYNPALGTFFRTSSEDLATFERWLPAGRNMAPAPNMSPDALFSVTSDASGYYLFAVSPLDLSVHLSYNFDRKSWKTWYPLAKKLAAPPNRQPIR